MTAFVKPPPLPLRASAKPSRLWLLVVCALPVGVLLAIFIGWRLTNWSAVRRLEREARRQGDPLTLSELARTYAPISDEENAAIPLMELWEAEEPEFWRAFRAGKSRLPQRTHRQA